MSEQYVHFEDKYHDALTQWHESLYHNKGDRAALRRCASPEEVLMTKGFRTLLQSVAGFKTLKDEKLMAYACVAGVLAHVKEHDKNGLSFAKQMAKTKDGGDKPLISELRLSQLQKSYNWDEFYRSMIRTTKILGKELNIIAIADAILHWGNEFDGNYATEPMKRLQVKWANAYYQVLLKDNIAEQV